jgi:hypothetical protein
MNQRGSDINTIARLRAICGSQSLIKLGARLAWSSDVGRPPAQPAYVLMAFGVMARLARSGIRVERDLAEPEIWAFARKILADTAKASGLDLPPPAAAAPRWDHWRWARDHHLATDDGLGQLAREFPAVAAELALQIGLCRPGAPGSFTHPDTEQCIYGDGTLVRPLYQPPATHAVTQDDGTTKVLYPHPRTGELCAEPVQRFDPDLQPHHGRLGPVLTHGYVAWHARGPAPYQRVVLAAAHIPAPGQEAATSVRLAGDVYRHLGKGIKAAIYDGAMHGVHIEEMMRRYGWLVLAKTPEAINEGVSLIVNKSGKRARSYPLGTVTHQASAGVCAHQLAAIDGAVVELGLDDTGDPVVTATLERGPIKRSRRSGGQYYFNVAYKVPCRTEPFTTWLSPHPGKGTDLTRPHNLRIINQSDPDFARLYGLRNDSENFHSNLKRTMLVNRQMSLGWRRGLLDIYCFAVLNNALTEQRAREAAAAPTRARGLRAVSASTR